MFKTLLYEVKDGIATVTFNRPELSNAFGNETYDEVCEAMEKANKDEAVRVVIITGVGRNFSAGGDVKSFKKMIEDKVYIPYEGVLKAGAMSRSIKTCWKPVIGMINGAAAGAGAAVALACDYRVMATDSNLIMSFIMMGLSGDTGAMFLLNSMIGSARTTEIMANGRPISAEKATELGIVNKVVPPEELKTATLTLATQLKHMPMIAFARQKQLSYEFFFSDMEEFAEREADYMHETSKTADFEEAVSAFLEKRPPKFTGK